MLAGALAPPPTLCAQSGPPTHSQSILDCGLTAGSYACDVADNYTYENTSGYDYEVEEKQALSGRKRDRNIEAELLIGNIDVVTSSFVAGPAAWDRLKYAEKQKLEEQVNKTYKIGEKIAQPSRLQNKKHQINSLAQAAANVELEMFDAKGARNKSKAETQAKYGW
jgi:Mitotic checkpoint regulator, MAD2B-interacting